MAAFEIVRPVGAKPAPTTARPPDGCLWGVADVAKFLVVPVSTLYDWRRTGYGPRARRVGRHLRYDPDEVKAWFHALDDEAV